MRRVILSLSNIFFLDFFLHLVYVILHTQNVVLIGLHRHNSPYCVIDLLSFCVIGTLSHMSLYGKINVLPLCCRREKLSLHFLCQFLQSIGRTSNLGELKQSEGGGGDTNIARHCRKLKEMGNI